MPCRYPRKSCLRKLFEHKKVPSIAGGTFLQIKNLKTILSNKKPKHDVKQINSKGMTELFTHEFTAPELVALDGALAQGELFGDLCDGELLEARHLVDMRGGW